MSQDLLDVNVVIALLDPGHVHHERAHRWFAGRGGDPWYTCPTVQNGVVRIVSHPRYPNTQPTTLVAASLASLVALSGHRFLADSISLLASPIRAERLLASSQVTDAYLLALAVSHGARLATFDTRIAANAVEGGDRALLVLP